MGKHLRNAAKLIIFCGIPLAMLVGIIIAGVTGQRYFGLLCGALVGIIYGLIASFVFMDSVYEIKDTESDERDYKMEIGFDGKVSAVTKIYLSLRQ